MTAACHHVWQDTPVHPCKGKGALPPLLQQYSCEASCANKWCRRFPVMSLTEGPWLLWQEENKSLRLILMPALSGKGAGRQTHLIYPLPSKTWKFRGLVQDCFIPVRFYFWSTTDNFSGNVSAARALSRQKRLRCWGEGGWAAFCTPSSLLGTATMMLTWQEL